MVIKKGRKSHSFLFILLFLILIGIGLFIAPMLEKRIYLLEYEDTILRYSQEYELDPYFVAAVIHCESEFDANAQSPKGALGLMQIMPKTGEWIATKVEEPSYTQEKLYSPEVNIKFGCWYLSYLQRKYSKDIVLTLAGYNAGPGTVDKWLKDELLSSAGELKSIPYEETKNYVEKVQNAYKKYQKIYPECW